jgi:serine/alanine adding enzyme
MSSITTPGAAAPGTRLHSAEFRRFAPGSVNKTITVRPYRPEDRVRWDAYVQREPQGKFYHHSGWNHVIEKTFGHEIYRWIAEDGDGHINGVLPLVHMKSLLFGSFMVSLPYLNYGGVCAQDDATHRALVQAAVAVAERKNVEYIELRYDRSLHSGLPVKESKVSMRLELPANPSDLWKALGSKLRSQIARPQKEGMYGRIGREEELDSFYRVFSINMKDLGTPVYPKAFFKNILDEFPQSTWICSIYDKHHAPVASGFLTGFKRTLEIPWASSLKKFNRFSPNMLLYWTTLKFACDNGYETFDFGRSTRGSGTYKFKAQWGAQPVPLYWHYWLRSGVALPELNLANPKYQLAIRLWRKLPLAVATILGPLIVKNIP